MKDFALSHSFGVHIYAQILEVNHIDFPFLTGISIDLITSSNLSKSFLAHTSDVSGNITINSSHQNLPIISESLRCSSIVLEKTFKALSHISCQYISFISLNLSTSKNRTVRGIPFLI
jgi:hypothetical protein